MADDDLLDCGWSVGHESVIEDNFRDRFRRSPMSEDWEVLNKDVERNAERYLKTVLDGARNEGHSGDELVGSCWVSWMNRKGLEVVYDHLEDGTNPHEFEGGEGFVWRGCRMSVRKYLMLN